MTFGLIFGVKLYMCISWAKWMYRLCMAVAIPVYAFILIHLVLCFLFSNYLFRFHMRC